MADSWWSGSSTEMVLVRADRGPVPYHILYRGRGCHLGYITPMSEIQEFNPRCRARQSAAFGMVQVFDSMT